MFSKNFRENIRKRSQNLSPSGYTQFGKVQNIVGQLIEAQLPGAPVGARVLVHDDRTQASVQGEVVGFKGHTALIIPLANPSGIGVHAKVQTLQSSPTIRVGDALLGRVIDAQMQPLDGKILDLSQGQDWPLNREPLNPLQRKRITKPLELGVKAIDGLLTCGQGQRVGVFAGSGVGKSVLLGMMTRYTNADINIIALIGERGREVRDFLEQNLGEEGLARSIVVASTGDDSPLSRVRGATVATALAEYYRDVENKNVLLVMDSLTRVAMAQREIGLAVGEPPTTKGYTPSVFNLLPKLLERSGNSQSQGSLSALYTVLVDGDDMNEPIADACRGILDGHIVLSRDIAAKGQYPAIDVLSSISRVMADVVSDATLKESQVFRKYLALYKKKRRFNKYRSLHPRPKLRPRYSSELPRKLN